MTRPTRPEDIRHPAEVWQINQSDDVPARPRYHSDPAPTVRMLGVFLVFAVLFWVGIIAGAFILGGAIAL